MAELSRSSSNQKEKVLNDKIKQLAIELQKHKHALDATLLLKEHAEIEIDPIVPEDDDESESAAVVVASDWHTEETVNPDSVNQRNEFNLVVAEARIERFFANLIKLVKLHRNSTSIKTLILALLGDFITGYIHEELVETNSLSPTEATLFVMKHIRRGMQLIEAEGGFERIIVPCCVGNHGRTTQKKRIKTSHINSFEWMMYHILEMVKPSDKWEFKIANGYHCIVPCYQYRLRFHHGDAMDYQGGIGGITIPVIKAIAGWDKETPADIDIFGHFHQRLEHPKFVSNGCLIGYSDFSVQVKAGYEPPSQTFFLVEKDRGRTTTNPIFLS